MKEKKRELLHGFREGDGVTKCSQLKYRFFWTWDHSMDWVPLTLGVQEFGAYNPYQKMPEDFVQDYRNIIDFSAANGFTGVIIYGFLRDCHGNLAKRSHSWQRMTAR